MRLLLEPLEVGHPSAGPRAGVPSTTNLFTAMKTTIWLVMALFIGATCAWAQTVVTVDAEKALNARKAIAESVLNGTSAESALAQLRGTKSISGLPVPSVDADIGFAANDIGLRLLSAGKPEAAEKFFREAEQALAKAVKETPDEDAASKAEYLSALSFVRAQFLNKKAEAKADLDEVLRLKPDHPTAKQARERLVNSAPEIFKTQPTQPEAKP